MKADLLIEIGTEEIPASYVSPAAAHFTRAFLDMLEEERIGRGAAAEFSTPRRIALLVTGVEEMQRESRREVTGPPARIAFDADGKPTKAAEGFAKTNGVSLDELRVVETPKGKYVAVTVLETPRPARDVIGDILPGVISSIPFPKTMRWEESGFLFARPIRWIVLLYGDDVIPIEIAGVKSGRASRGHRILHGAPVEIPSPAAYEAALKGAFVIPSAKERKARIEREIERVAGEGGESILPDPGLVDQVNFLVEYPHALSGRFDRRYLELPEKVVITAMRSHQRYFALRDRKGSLAPRFITVANGTAKNEPDVRAGNERVLAARLADAEFYWNEDRSVSLADRTARLDRLLWQKGLGSMLDKTERIGRIASAVVKRCAPEMSDTVSRAALLSKADLTTEMIRDGKEFTALQGYMGMEYARESGESDDVALALFEQYLPRFSEDDLPSSIPGAILSLADRADTLAGCLAIGKAPTGSRDPYALRRHARAILRILAGGAVAFPLTDLVGAAVEGYGGIVKNPAAVKEACLGFLAGRMKNLLTEKGFPYDVVDAVLAGGLDDPADVERRTAAITAFRESDTFTGLILGFRRVVNILKKAEEGAGEVDRALLREDAEKRLHAAVEEMIPSLEEAIGARRYRTAMELLLALRGTIDDFFDGVLVMDPDDAVRSNRIALLRRIAHLFNELADLSKVVLEGETDPAKG